MSLLWPYHANNDTMFPNRVQREPYDFGMPDDQEWFVEDLIGHRWTEGNNLEFEVQWSLGNTTWEPMSSCKELATLDQYLEIQGVQRPSQLAKHGTQIAEEIAGPWEHP
ncbi:hypothetical protein L208DRAFT_1497903, partial [Tricholoma matsutake]